MYSGVAPDTGIRSYNVYLSERSAMSIGIENRIVLVDVRNVYGNEKYYPANREAELFAKINGAKTLSRQTIGWIQELGYRIEVKPREVLL